MSNKDSRNIRAEGDFGEIGRQRKSFAPFRGNVFTAFVPFGLVKE